MRALIIVLTLLVLTGLTAVHESYMEKKIWKGSGPLIWFAWHMFFHCGLGILIGALSTMFILL